MSDPLGPCALLSVGFSKKEYWSGLPFPSPGDLPDPGMEHASLMSPALAGRFFITSATWDSPSGQKLTVNYVFLFALHVNCLEQCLVPGKQSIFSFCNRSFSILRLVDVFGEHIEEYVLGKVKEKNYVNNV